MELIKEDGNGRKYIVYCCDRCGKFTDGIHTCTPNPVIEQLRAENEALRKDAERIDFIATEMNRTVHFLAGRWYWSRNPYKTYMRKDDIRKAIDAAMNK